MKMYQVKIKSNHKLKKKRKEKLTCLVASIIEDAAKRSARNVKNSSHAECAMTKSSTTTNSTQRKTIK